MITYSTNWMGPINKGWIEKYGEGWSAGRIDIRNIPDKEYWNGWHEYSLPPMKTEDWNDFSYWLDGFETHELWDFDTLIKHYENASNKKIRWLNENEQSY